MNRYVKCADITHKKKLIKFCNYRVWIFEMYEIFISENFKYKFTS